MRSPLFWHLEAVARDREVILTCCRAASLFSRFCPPEAIENYIRACARVQRQARWCDLLVSAISAFGAPLIMMGFDGGIGLVAGAVFIALWAFIGLDQCMTHISRMQAEAVARECAKLARFARVNVILPESLLFPNGRGKP